MSEPSRQVPPMTLKPPPQGKRSGPSFWQWVAIAAGVLVVIGIASNSSGGGSSDTGATKSAVAAKPDCGTPSPQDPAGVVNAYLDGPGSPVVAGKPGCGRIAALWAGLRAARRVKVAPYVALERAATRTGWALIDPEDPRWRSGNAVFARSAFAKTGGGDPSFVFVRPGAALVFVDLEP